MLRKRSLELLEGFLWLADAASSPSLSNLLGTRPNDRRLYRLADEDYLDRARDENGNWVYRLTNQGRLAALGGLDPERQWNRPWDGKWRVLMFDLPGGPQARRHQLWRWLKEHHFGCLQRSVWISPDPLETSGLAAFTVDRPGEFILLEGNTVPSGARDEKAIAAAAWNFDDINERHADYIDILDACPGTGSADDFAAWRERESTAWSRIVKADPLLPAALLPDGYPGLTSWENRTALRKRIGTATTSAGV